MEVSTNGTSEVIVNGIIKSIDDSMALKAAVKRLHEAGATSIVLKINDSFALPSASIGFLMKLVNHDKVRLNLIAGDKRLVELLDELQLTAMFGVTYSPANKAAM